MAFAFLSNSQEKQINNAHTYQEWAHLAKEIDDKSGASAWRADDYSPLFDYRAVCENKDNLRSLRKQTNYQELLFTLNEGIHGNINGIGNPKLYQHSLLGTKHLIEDYLQEVSESLLAIAAADESTISRAEKRDFFDRADKCYGCSALMLSGSGMLAYFHLGVMKALIQNHLMPDVLSGSSGGAFICAMVAANWNQRDGDLFDAEFLSDKQSSPISLLNKLTPEIASATQIRSLVDRLIPDVTFEEVKRSSGIDINISIAPAEAHQRSRLLNSVTSPHVLVRDGVMASCALPGFFPPVMLQARDFNNKTRPYLPNRKWVDGAISDDLPAKRLSRLYGVNHYIVSQTNPHILPFLRDSQQLRGAGSILTSAVSKTAKEWINASAEIFQKPLSLFPGVNQVTNTALAVMNQDYMGDVNILPPFKFPNPARLLASLLPSEIDKLIKMGERAAWPQLEKIRIQTLVSRTLNQINQQIA